MSKRNVVLDTGSGAETPAAAGTMLIAPFVEHADGTTWIHGTPKVYSLTYPASKVPLTVGEYFWFTPVDPAGKQKLGRIPSGSGDITYADLPYIDPTTLDPAAVPPEPAWTDALHDKQDAADLDDDTAALAADDMSALAQQVLATIGATAGLKHKTADAVRYVSPTGNNSNDGLSPGSSLATLTAAVTALPTEGGEVNINGGTHTLSASALPDKSFVTFRGAGKGVTKIHVTSGNLFAPTADVFGLKFKDLTIQTTSADLIALGSTGGLVGAKFENCSIDLAADGASFISQSGAGDVIGNSFPGTDINRLGSATVPAIKIVNTAAAANANDFGGLTIYGNNCTAAPAIHIESSVTGTYAYDNNFDGIVGEQNAGGLLRLLSVQGLNLKDVYDWDATTAYTADVVHVGKSPTSTTLSRNVMAMGVGRRGGTLGGGVFDFNAVPGEVNNVFVVHPGNSSVTPVFQVPASAVVFGSLGAGYTAGQTARFTGSTVFESTGWSPATFRNLYPTADPVSFEEGVTGMDVPSATSQSGAMWIVRKFADAGARLMAAASGKLWWGDGSGTSFDTSLERSAAGTLSQGAANAFRTGRAVTVSRPTASVVGQGAQFFDTTLNRPIWSDGSTWNDALPPSPRYRKMLSGCYYGLAESHVPSVAGTADGREMASPFYVHETITIAAIAAEVTTLSTGVLRFGIYNNDPATDLPSTVLHDVGAIDGTVSVTSTGVKEVTLATPLVLTPGLYWLSCVPQGGTPAMRSQVGSQPPVAATSFIGSSATVGMGHYFRTGISGALTTWGTPGAAGSGALVKVKIA